jgi:hypothetical protein
VSRRAIFPQTACAPLSRMVRLTQQSHTTNVIEPGDAGRCSFGATAIRIHSKSGYGAALAQRMARKPLDRRPTGRGLSSSTSSPVGRAGHVDEPGRNAPVPSVSQMKEPAGRSRRAGAGVAGCAKWQRARQADVETMKSWRCSVIPSVSLLSRNTPSTNVLAENSLVPPMKRLREKSISRCWRE